MAKAVVTYRGLSGNEEGFTLICEVLYYGADIKSGAGDLSKLDVMISNDNTVDEIRAKVAEAVAADAQTWGHDVPADSIMIPAWS